MLILHTDELEESLKTVTVIDMIRSESDTEERAFRMNSVSTGRYLTTQSGQFAVVCLGKV